MTVPPQPAPSGGRRPNPREVITTQALGVWVASMAVYVMAITGRTSFGVAGLEAMDRFHASSAAIAVFTSIQVGTYALAQIPTGMAIDKWGPRTMLVLGAVVMGVGQIVLGFTDQYAVAVAARILIGAGDATAFLSVMRILPYWFPLHRTPVFTQVSSAIGQLGQFVSAIPFLWFLGLSGWTVAFVSLGSVVIVVAIAAAVAVADSPEKAGVLPRVPAAAEGAPSRLHLLRFVFASPTAWNSFFIHFTGLIISPIFVLMWGMPLMTQAMGFSATQAGLMLTINSVALIVLGPFHGRISARLSGKRDWVTMCAAAVLAAGWAWYFWTDSPRGLWATAAVLILLAAIQPVCNYGFDKVRERLPRQVVATATGLTNMGGFIAGMAGTQLVGFVLDHRGGLNWHDFRYAAAAVGALWLVGFAGITITHFMERAHLRAAAATGAGR